jgi:hypothetical protein
MSRRGNYDPLEADLILYLESDSDAFAYGADEEVARLLREIADRIEAGEATGLYQTIHDTNGNDVGRFRWRGPKGE